MKEIAPGRMHLTVPEARTLAESALRALGYDDEQARIIGDHVLDAALCGYEYSGLPKILNLPEHPRFKLPRTPIRLLRETAVSKLFDAGNNNAMYALQVATRAGIDLAKDKGIAVIGVTNSWVSGRSAYYMEMLANADLVGIHTVSCSRAVAPYGGIAPVLGTNPLAFAVPSSRGPVILDMGTSAFMMTDLLLHERQGRQLPDGVGIDATGKPSRDPTQVKLGALLPFGGHKGYGLAFMMQAFGLLAGALLDAEQENAYLFIIFTPELLTATEQFKHEMSDLVDRVKATRRAPGVDEIRIPSERAFRERARLSREGIVIDRFVFERLSAL
ncbi:MAG: Ldh family oxidoreductase [Betaproteobacteria bacterium]